MFFTNFLPVLNQQGLTVFIDAFLYEVIIIYVFGFVLFVLFLLFCVLRSSFLCRFYFHGGLIETFWTVVPLLVLGGIVLPRIWIVFVLEPLRSKELTVKVVGHQWYWTYFLGDFNLQLDRYITPCEDLALGKTNLLVCDTPCVLPFLTNLDFFVTSRDVLHRWAVPGLCLKNDAIPGISSGLSSLVEQPGCFTGMCRELCGAYHAFMPINLEISSFSLFEAWLENNCWSVVIARGKVV